MDERYDDYITANSILKGLREGAEDEWKSKGVAARWAALFQVADLPEMLTIISHILSFPAPTGYVGRILSRLTNKCSDGRNRCSVEPMRSELMITLSLEHCSSEFYSSILKDSRQSVLQGVTRNTSGEGSNTQRKKERRWPFNRGLLFHTDKGTLLDC